MLSTFALSASALVICKRASARSTLATSSAVISGESCSTAPRYSISARRKASSFPFLIASASL